jgi:hypothetical protein
VRDDREGAAAGDFFFNGLHINQIGCRVKFRVCFSRVLVSLYVGSMSRPNGVAFWRLPFGNAGNEALLRQQTEGKALRWSGQL